MQVNQDRIRISKHFAPLATAIERSIGNVTTKYHYLLPRGWRLIVKLKKSDRSQNFFVLDLQADQGGGSYAAAKMSTLEILERDYTGGDKITDILHMLEELNLDDSEIANAIRDLESPWQMTKNQKEWLRDTHGIASMYGGIYIQYKSLFNNINQITEEDNSLRVAFSGASQEQDLFFTFWIIRTIQDTLSQIQPHVYHSYCLERLQGDPTVRFYLDLLGISTTDRNYSDQLDHKATYYYAP